MNRLAILAVFVLLVVAGCGQSVKLDAPLEPLSDKSKLVKLADMKGKVVLIDFWATTCGPCHLTMPTIEELYTKYRDKGFTVAAITNEDRATVQKFVDNSVFSYPVYLDGMGAATSDFGVSSIPFAVLLGKDGQVIDTYLGAPLDKAKLKGQIERALRQ